MPSQCESVNAFVLGDAGEPSLVLKQPLQETQCLFSLCFGPIPHPNGLPVVLFEVVIVINGENPLFLSLISNESIEPNAIINLPQTARAAAAETTTTTCDDE